MLNFANAWTRCTEIELDSQLISNIFVGLLYLFLFEGEGINYLKKLLCVHLG